MNRNRVKVYLWIGVFYVPSLAFLLLLFQEIYRKSSEVISFYMDEIFSFIAFILLKL